MVITFKPIKQAIADMFDVTDKFVDDKCSKCGECCGRVLPITDKEIKNIKKYIKGKKLKIYPASQKTCLSEIVNFNCPFLDPDAENKCQIYPVRPKICKVYTCRDQVQKKFKPLSKRFAFDMYNIFN